LIAVLRHYLPRYRLPIIVVLTLLLVQALAQLYLPELNADIINNGVAKGDQDYILQTGAYMLLVTFALMVAAIISVYFSARISMGLPSTTTFMARQVLISGRASGGNSTSTTGPAIVTTRPSLSSVPSTLPCALVMVMSISRWREGHSWSMMHSACLAGGPGGRGSCRSPPASTDPASLVGRQARRPPPEAATIQLA